MQERFLEEVHLSLKENNLDRLGLLSNEELGPQELGCLELRVCVRVVIQDSPDQPFGEE